MSEKIIPDHNQLFTDYYKPRAGVGFKLLGYCSQQVAGKNYCLEVEETIITTPPFPTPSVKYHYFYVDINGNVKDLGVKDTPPEPMEGVGTWSCYKL